jgi:hypothetical protein
MWWKNFQFHTRIVVDDAFTLAVVVVVAAVVVEVRPFEVDYDASYKPAIILLMLLLILTLSTLLWLLLLLR